MTAASIALPRRIPRPGPRLWTPPHLDLHAPRLSHEQAMTGVIGGMREGLLGNEERAWTRAADKFIRWMAGFSDVVEAKILDHIFNDGTYSAPTPYAALGTGAILDTDVAASFGGTTEANYTSYARVSVAAADMNAASAGSKNNGNPITFANCTGSSSAVIAWCTCSAGPARLAAGDVIIYGTVTLVTIDITHTPPTIAATGLVANLD
jgi:hypothetical protein